MIRYDQIPQFKKKGIKETSWGISALVDVIKEWEENDGLKINPDFQRGHVWTENQQIKFIEFLLRGGQSGKEIYFNDPCIDLEYKKYEDLECKEYSDFVCVDGLQRITAIQKFVNNEIKVFQKYYYKDFQKSIILEPRITVHTNNLKTKQEVLEWYLEMNEGGVVHSSQEILRIKDMLHEELKKSAKHFSERRSLEDILNIARNNGWEIDATDFHQGGDWIWLVDFTNRLMQIKFNPFNGHFDVYGIWDDEPFANHKSIEFDNEKWYKELLNLFYIK